MPVVLDTVIAAILFVPGSTVALPPVNTNGAAVDVRLSVPLFVQVAPLKSIPLEDATVTPELIVKVPSISVTSVDVLGSKVLVPLPPKLHCQIQDQG